MYVHTCYLPDCCSNLTIHNKNTDNEPLFAMISEALVLFFCFFLFYQAIGQTGQLIGKESDKTNED